MNEAIPERRFLFSARWWRGAATWCVVCLGVAATAADSEDDARRAFLSGNYRDCVRMAEAALKDQGRSEEWRLLLTESLWTLGRYAEARSVITNALAQETRSIRLRWLGREVFRSNGEPEKAADQVREILQLVSARPWAYREAADLVVVGRAALQYGADPKQVLDRVFAQAKKADPNHRDVYLASGEVALEKHDFALAAKTFQEGLAKLREDPDLLAGVARAYAPSETPLMVASLEAALKRNSNHVASLLLLADHLIDAEEYTEVERLLDRALAVNPWQPEAWAYRAVIAHLRNEPQREQLARETALKFWPTNPRVPHLIGRKLSQQYRFAEGAALQREALKFDRKHLPAKAQLALDLLRLGEEAEGWRLAEEVQEQDGYDVNALNLTALHDKLAKFHTLTNSRFTVRMTPHEAALYGGRVLELLEQARQRLGPKYGFDLAAPLLVEVFPQQTDFAVRTFGLPESHGFLGVCFGRVITANSPAARPGQRFNWEAMLWHEFTHVITLQLTRHKIPRWLSEGISVYEERQANPAWGERLTPRYREMILGEDLTPVAKLSAAFLAPQSREHLQFAYYQSSLVVQFLVERFGFGKLRAILRTLGEGGAINEAIAKHAAPLTQVEHDFAAYARQRATELAPGLDWRKPDRLVEVKGRLLGDPDLAWADWAKLHPNNFWVLTRRASEFIEAQRWTEAKTVLERLVQEYPSFTGSDSAYLKLAEVHRALGDTRQERLVLARLTEIDEKAVDACGRLMQLAAEVQDWSTVGQAVRRYLAVNPLVALPYRFLAQASEAQGQTSAGIEACRALLELDPPNPAEVHYDLARLLHRAGEPAARRHVLQALEEAPRYRAALQLLLEIHAAAGGSTTAAVTSPEGKP